MILLMLLKPMIIKFSMSCYRSGKKIIMNHLKLFYSELLVSAKNSDTKFYMSCYSRDKKIIMNHFIIINV